MSLSFFLKPSKIILNALSQEYYVNSNRKLLKLFFEKQKVSQVLLNLYF